MAALYTIEPKDDGSGFTLTTPQSSQPFGFPTKEDALAAVRKHLGDDGFKRATLTDRADGGINVYIP